METNIVNQMTQVLNDIKGYNASLESLYQETIISLANMINLIEYNMFQSRQNDGINLWRSHYLARELVVSADLKFKMELIEKELAQYSLLPVISSNDHQLYYEYPLTHCLEDDNELAITLSVPVRRNRQSWKAFSVVPLPFRVNGLQCVLPLVSPWILINPHDQLIPISECTAYCTEKEGLSCLFQLQYYAHRLKNPACELS